MARGRRTSLADLAGAVGDERNGQPHSHGQSRAPLTTLIANPRNPREGIGEVSDLASIAEIQLQPAVVITREAYLRLWPQDDLGDARWVVVNGCRRLKAAHEFGRTDLEIVIKDEIAKDRATLQVNAIRENVDRKNFDVIEEAKAVEALVSDCDGRADIAAIKLNRSDTWVSQRRALLKLAPELQEKLRAGELAVRLARELARVPLAQQVSAWQAALDRQEGSDTDEGKKPKNKNPNSAHAAKVVKALRTFETEPERLAGALKEALGDGGVEKLLEVLGRSAST
ncbi:peptide transporter [Skermania sp. ID1734]|uniref:ParB/RepB/Spo0J family partition protein n=1 Tax=Skermania sp. ID1734 TaxID=2597516 RepID=UPI001180FBB7|nr:ParB N-terminal domain-containing protein [Skermania sp. ID1734]TSD93808.1 peptide transporter [Skermania sp. ID1734]